MEAQETDERIKMFYLMVINSDFDYQVIEVKRRGYLKLCGLFYVRKFR